MSRARKARLRGPSLTWAQRHADNRRFDYMEALRALEFSMGRTSALVTDQDRADMWRHHWRGLQSAQTVKWLRSQLDARSPGWTIRRVRQRWLVYLAGSGWAPTIRRIHDGHMPGVAMAVALAHALRLQRARGVR